MFPKIQRRARPLPDLPDDRFQGFDLALRDGSPRVLSLDCFDTLLWRRVPKPSDIHLLTGTKLCTAGLLASHISPHGYSHLRHLAEEEARRRQMYVSGSTEVTLEQIHAVLEPSVAVRPLGGATARAELEVERENVFADLRLANYVRELLKEVPLRLIAVSDSYFSPTQIRSLLDQPELHGLEFELVYTSSGTGTGKGAQLWDTVIEDLGVAPGEVVHIGDNEVADVQCARRLGLRAFHYPVSSERFVTVEIRERIVGTAPYPTQYCDAARGDAGLTAVRRRASWSALADGTVDVDSRVAWETGTSVFGPVFTGFAQWVQERSRDEGAQRLLFLMREGKFLKELVDKAAQAGEWSPTTRTAWVSREACARASVYDGLPAELEGFLDRLRPPSPLELAGSLGLDPAEVPAFDRLHDEFQRTPDRDAVARAFIDIVLDDAGLLEKVVVRSAERRARLMGYLRRIAGAGEGPVGLVDVGWSGSIQESLETMFHRSGDPIVFRGFYLLAHVGSSGRVLRGSHLQGFLGTTGTNPFDIAAITGGAEILELVSTSREGSLLEMGPDGEPILAAPVSGERERTCRELVQQGVLAYQDEWLSYRQPDMPTFETTPTGVDLLTRILKRFVSQPNLDEALAFGWWLHEENYGSEQAEPLVPARYRDTVAYRTAEDLHWAPMSDLHWTGGAAALVDHATTDAIFFMREGAIDPGRFSSPPQGACRVSVLAGDQEISSASIPIVRNRRGLSLVEWRGPVVGATEVVLRPADTFTLFRLDRLAVVDAEGAVESEPVFSWVLGSDPQRLRLTGLRWVSSQVMAIDGSSMITVGFPEPLNAPELRVTMEGAFLPVSTEQPDSPLSTDPEAENAALRQEIENLYHTKLFRLAAFPRRVYAAIRRRATSGRSS
jgi:FMN phosphatase YigB (HAD superfamily)